MQLVRLISSISPPIFGIVTCVYISGRPLLSSPREWKIRHGHKTRAILLELLGGRKNTVLSKKCVHFGGFGEGYGGLMGVERRVFEGTDGFKEEGRLWRSGGRQRRLRTTAARKGSSKSSLWVRGRPGDGERLPAVAFFVLFCARFDTCHVHSGGASAPSHSYMCIKKKNPALDEHIFVLVRQHVSDCETCGPSALPSVSLPPALCSIFAPFF